MLVLSQRVERSYARELWADGGIGHLLKDRVFDADQFIDAVRRVASDGMATDPQVTPGARRSDHRTNPSFC
ncbi:hypothetical protein GCM10010518_17660 [Kitasatospora cinereorecta]